MLDILFEDEELLVLNKPSGIHSASLPNSKDNTVASLLLTYLPSLTSVSEKEEDSGLVNRLDFETSGVLLVAKTRESWKILKGQLKEGAISKKYLVLLEGNAPASSIVDALLHARHRRSQKMLIGPPGKKNKRAQPACTDFKRLHYNTKYNASLVEASAPVARRHQVRAHAAHMGHSLWGDELYGSKKLISSLGRGTKDLPKFLLHASSLSLVHPKSKEKISFEAPLPKSVALLLENLFPKYGNRL